MGASRGGIGWKRERLLVMVMAWAAGCGSDPLAIAPPSPPPPPPPPGSAPVDTLQPTYAAHVPGSARDVAVDGAGNLVVVGGTTGLAFPTTAGVFPRNASNQPPAASDPSDVFIMKVSPAGQTIWAGVLGGPGHDRAYGVALDPQGNIYVAGRAGTGFPVTAGAFQTQFMGGSTNLYGTQDGFVCKLRPDGSAVVWCSYFGASDPRIVRDVAADASGNVYLASGWEGGTYPAAVAQQFRNSPHGGTDAVAAKIAPDGKSVLWARYLGGSKDESNENSIQVDAAGNPYFLCTTESPNAPTPNGAQRTFAGGTADLYLSRLSPADGSQVWATFIGGSDNESTETHELTVAASGEPVVAAPTRSTDFPVTAGAFQAHFAGGTNDMFVSRYSPDGRLLAATLIGGNSNDRPEGVAVDQAGNVHLTGTTASSDFPTTPGAFQSKMSGPRDGVVVVLPPDLGSLLSSSYFGGPGEEYGRGAAVGSGGVTAVVGESSSANFPGAASAPGSWPGFMMRLTGTKLP